MITKVYRNPKSLKTKIMLDKAGLIVYHGKKNKSHFLLQREDTIERNR